MSSSGDRQLKKPSAPSGNTGGGGVFTPSGFVPRATPMPKDQAPYKHGQSPAQRTVRRRRALAPVPVFTPPAPVTPTVDPAQDHASTLALQRQLRRAGYGVAEDGVYGPQTAAAYRAWQEKTGHVGHPAAQPHEQAHLVTQHSNVSEQRQTAARHHLEAELGSPQGMPADQAPYGHGESPAQQQWISNHPGVVNRRIGQAEALAARQPRAGAYVKPSADKRYVPNYKGEPVATYEGGLRNPDGSWVEPGTRPQPGARVSQRPVYTDAFTHESTRGQVNAANEQTQFEAQFGKDFSHTLDQANKDVNPHVAGVLTGAAELIPGVASAKQYGATGRVSAGTAFGDIANGALWLVGVPEVRAVAKAAGTGGDVVAAFRDARAAEKAAGLTRMEDSQIMRNVRGSESRMRYQQTLKDAGYSRKAQKSLLARHDAAAATYAEHQGVTPAQAWDRIYAHSQYNDVAVTKSDITSGRVVFAQEGKLPEIANVEGTPATHLEPPDKAFLKKQAAALVRKHRAALPPEYNTPKKLHDLLTGLRERALEASDYKEWYANSANAILQHAQGDIREADKIAALIAVYSPRAEVYSFKTEWNNLDRALNAYRDYYEGGQISPKWSISSHKTGEGDWQTFRAQQIMSGNFEWDGLKTNRFYRNFLQHIDPAKYADQFGTEKFGTMDTWMRRAFKYPKQYKETGDLNLLGEAVTTGKAQEPITPSMYRFMEQANKAVGDSLGWSPEEVQAAIWTSVKAESEGTPLERAGFDFSHGFEHREARKAQPLAPDQLALDTTRTTDEPMRSAVDNAIDASRQPDSGFTLTANLHPDAPVRGKGRFIVAYGAYESRDKAPLAAEKLLAFRNAHIDALRADPALRIGGWHNPDDGQIYLDLSKTFDTQDEAMQFARDQGQLAIFDRENPDASLPTGLQPAEADGIKSALREDVRISQQGARYDKLLMDAHVSQGGKVPRSGVLSKADTKSVEDMLWDMSKRLDPETRAQFEQLAWEAQMAKNAPDPEVLFQDDAFVQAIADAHGIKSTREAAIEAYRGRDLKGLPKSRASNDIAQSVARDYMRDAGLSYAPPLEYTKVDPERAKRIADWYDAAQDAPDDPAVRASYDAMIRETKAQYDAITKAGYRFEFYPAEDPYPSGPSAAIDDLRSNQHMYVFPTEGGFGSLTEAQKAHPLLADSGITWGDQNVTHNDLFRAVHDFFGHFKEGVGFRADGEENAWRAHVAMFSDEAKPAMTAETRGQNSWVNYGPHGEANKTADQMATVYADQKAVLAPDWAITEGSGAPAGPKIKGAVQRLTTGEHILHLFKGADISTAVHEFGHALETMIPAASRDALRAAGIHTEEQFARSFERYFYDGEAPSAADAAMRDIAVEMSKVYRTAQDIPDALASPEIKQQFDKFFVRESRLDPTFASTAAADWFAQSLTEGEGRAERRTGFPRNLGDLQTLERSGELPVDTEVQRGSLAPPEGKGTYKPNLRPEDEIFTQQEGGASFPAWWGDRAPEENSPNLGIKQVYEDARSWLADTAWANMEPEDFWNVSDTQVAKAIEKYYDGGMSQFISDGGHFDSSPTWLAQGESTQALDAAAMQVEHGNTSIEDAAKMFNLVPAELQAHIDSGAYAKSMERITSNADVGAGAAETPHDAKHYLGKWLSQEEGPEFSDESLANTHEPVPDLTPAEQVRRGLAGARSQYGGQKVARHEEAKIRAEKVRTALRTISDPDEAMAVAAQAMRGEMPKIELNGIIRDLDADALRELKSIVNHHESLLPFQAFRLNKALDAAVTEGRVPTPAEMRLIEHVFGKKTASGIAESAGSPAWDTFINIMNIPRTLMATADLSAIGRQSLVAGASHPIIWAKNFPTAFKAFRSPEFYEMSAEAIKNDPLYNLALAARVSFTDLTEGSALAAHEEAFASDYAAKMLDKVPYVPNVIKGSARSYVGFLNKMRMDLFRNQIRIALKAGRDVNDEAFLNALGDVVNAATGRGTIHGRAEHILPALNTLLFSPRLMLSRLNYLDPTWYYRLGSGLPKGAAKQVRLEALRGLFATAGAVTGVVTMASQIPGVDVGSTDPRNADFGKIKVGNTRIDVAGGFLQYTRLAAELATNTSVSSTTGVKEKLGSGFGIPTRWDAIQNFVYNKFAPVPAMAHNIIKGKDSIGDPVTPQSILLQNFTPLIVQDTRDLYKEHGGGGNGIAWALGGYGIGALGFGEQTYKAKDPAAKPTKTLEQKAKDAGMAPPTKAILLDLNHKSHLDTLSQQHKGDPQGRLDAYLKYYAETTDDHQYDHWIGKKMSDDAAARGADFVRGAMIGPGLSAYNAALKRAEAAK